MIPDMQIIVTYAMALKSVFVPMQTRVTPLMKATVAGHIKVVEILVDAGANVDLKDMVRKCSWKDNKSVRGDQCTCIPSM